MMERDAPAQTRVNSAGLPIFPEFRPIELEARSIIEPMIADFEPYADFNFVELWCWNRGELGGFSILNGNLVIRWEDVVSGELFLTFLGSDDVEATCETLIDYARARGMDDRLAAIPEIVFQNATPFSRQLLIEEDLVNSDYLLSTEEWSVMSGARFKNKRNAIHRLERYHDPCITRIDLSDGNVQTEVRILCQTWAALRQRPVETTRSEFDAIENLLVYASSVCSHRLYAVGVYVGSQMIGFSVNEKLDNGFGLGHFAKGDYRYEGIYPYMLRNVAQYLYTNGTGLLNIEADLGDPGLAIAKRLCHPTRMLKKYAVSRP